MKKLFIVPVLAVLMSCGEKEPEKEPIVLDTFEQKLSYVLGVYEGKKISNDPNFDSYNLDLLVAGFRENFSENDVKADCESVFKNLFGENQNDFNMKHVDEGSKCVGRYFANQVYMSLKSFDKTSVIDTTNLFQGFMDEVHADSILISQEEQETILMEFDKSVQAIIDQKMVEMYGENKKEGEDFLAENASKKGVVVTESGLQYEILKKGSGASPGPNNNVTVHYTGYFIDGTKFESSKDGGEPISFNVSGVIPGWTEVLQLMKKGAKYKVYIPQDLAYGANPNPQSPIEPYSALIFEIELIDFE